MVKRCQNDIVLLSSVMMMTWSFLHFTSQPSHISYLIVEHDEHKSQILQWTEKWNGIQNACILPIGVKCIMMIDSYGHRQTYNKSICEVALPFDWQWWFMIPFRYVTIEHKMKKSSVYQK